MQFNILLLWLTLLYSSAIITNNDITIFIKSFSGKQYELKVKTENNKKPTIADLKKIIIEYDYDDDIKKEYAELKDLAYKTLTGNFDENMAPSEEIQNDSMSLVQFLKNGKETTDTTEFENNEETIVFKPSENLLSNKNTEAITNVAQLLHNKNLKLPQQREQSANELLKFSLKLVNNQDNNELLEGIFKLTHYLDIPFFEQLPSIIAQNPELLNRKDFFITDSTIKNDIKEQLLTIFKDNLLQNSSYFKEINTLKGHTDYVRALALDSTGKLLASGSSDGTIKLWDMSNPHQPTEINTLKGHTKSVSALAWDPTGKLLASGSWDNIIKLWDMSNPHQPKEINTLKGHTWGVSPLAWDPTGKLLASGSSDGTIKLWDMSNPHQPKEISSLKGHAGIVYALAWDPTGKFLASGSRDDTIKLWDMSNPHQPKEINTLKGHNDEVSTLAWDPTGKLLASGSSDGTIKLWDMSNPHQPKEISSLKGHAGIVYALAWDPTGKFLASGSWDNTIKIWDMSNPLQPKEINTLKRHTSYVRALAWDPTGKLLASGSLDKTIKLWQRSIDPTITLEQIILQIILSKDPNIEIEVEKDSWAYQAAKDGGFAEKLTIKEELDVKKEEPTEIVKQKEEGKEIIQSRKNEETIDQNIHQEKSLIEDQKSKNEIKKESYPTFYLYLIKQSLLSMWKNLKGTLWHISR